jgi:hypothetical protein
MTTPGIATAAGGAGRPEGGDRLLMFVCLSKHLPKMTPHLKLNDRYACERIGFSSNHFEK